MGSWGEATATCLDIVMDGAATPLLEKPLKARAGVCSMATVERGKFHNTAGL